MEKRQVFTFILITWMVAVMLFGHLGNGQSAGRNNRRRRPVSNRRRVHGMNPDVHRAYLQALNRPAITTTSIPTSTTTGPDLSIFGIIPRLPEPHETECFVEIRVTERKRGTCIRPGGAMRRPFMCQSGMFLRVDPACQQIIENRIIHQNYLEQAFVNE